MIKRAAIVEQARQYTEAGKIREAIGEFQRLVDADPDDLKARLCIGYLHACNRDPEAAAGIYLEVAHTHERAGDVGQAAQVLSQVPRLLPDRSDVYFWLAELHKQLQQPAEARQWLEKASQHLVKKGCYRDALRALEAMVDLDPGNVALLIRLGEGYATQNQTEDAVDALGRAADVLRLAEWTDDFVRVGERLVYLQPGNGVMSKELATVYLRRHEPRTALQHLQRCYETDQADPGTLNLIIEAFMDLREIDKALTILEVLADVHANRGELDLCATVHSRIRQLTPLSDRAAAQGRRVTQTEIRARAEVEPSQDVSEFEDFPNTDVFAQPLELQEAQGSEPIPVTTDELNLDSLERSLQPTKQGDGARRFLPAVTARHQLITARNITTQELELSDLQPLDFFPPDIATQELALNDLHDLIGNAPEPREPDTQISQAPGPDDLIPRKHRS